MSSGSADPGPRCRLRRAACRRGPPRPDVLTAPRAATAQRSDGGQHLVRQPASPRRSSLFGDPPTSCGPVSVRHTPTAGRRTPRLSLDRRHQGSGFRFAQTRWTHSCTGWSTPPWPAQWPGPEPRGATGPLRPRCAMVHRRGHRTCATCGAPDRRTDRRSSCLPGRRIQANTDCRAWFPYSRP